MSKSKDFDRLRHYAINFIGSLPPSLMCERYSLSLPHKLIILNDYSTSSPIINNATFEIASGQHTIGVITGTGVTLLNDSAQLTVTSITQGTLTIGSGAIFPIQAIPSGLLAMSDKLSFVPEPAAVVLLGIGAISLLVYTRQRQKRGT